MYLLKYFGVDVSDEEFGTRFDSLLISSSVIVVVGFVLVVARVTSFLLGRTGTTGATRVTVGTSLFGVSVSVGIGLVVGFSLFMFFAGRRRHI